MSWQTYKGLELPSAPTGDAGINLKEDLKLLADRSLSGSAIPGSVIFVGGTTGSPVLEDDVGNFCWDRTNHRLGVGTATPLELVQIEGDGAGLLMATGTTSGTSGTMIIFGAGTSATTQFQRIRFIYGPGDLFFERKASDGTWSGIMKLDWSSSRVDVTGTGLLMATSPTDLEGETQILFGRPDNDAQFHRIWYVYSASDLKFQRRQSAGAAWTTIMTLDWFASRVGIGTETPTTLLEVAGAITLGEYAGTISNPPTGRAVLYVDDSGADPILKVRFDNGITKTLATGQ